MTDYLKIFSRTLGAREAAHRVLEKHEGARSRVISLERLQKELSGTPIDIQDYFKEAIGCLEHSFYRSAIVLAWSGHFSIFFDQLYQNHEKDILTRRINWKFSSADDLREQFAEAEFIKLAKDVGFVSKSKARVMDGNLATRNQCAHATLFKPSMNAAIGYVDDMIRQSLYYINTRSSTP